MHSASHDIKPIHHFFDTNDDSVSHEASFFFFSFFFDNRLCNMSAECQEKRECFLSDPVTESSIFFSILFKAIKKKPCFKLQLLPLLMTINNECLNKKYYIALSDTTMDSIDNIRSENRPVVVSFTLPYHSEHYIIQKLLRRQLLLLARYQTCNTSLL